MANEELQELIELQRQQIEELRKSNEQQAEQIQLLQKNEKKSSSENPGVGSTLKKWGDFATQSESSVAKKGISSAANMAKDAVPPQWQAAIAALEKVAGSIMQAASKFEQADQGAVNDVKGVVRKFAEQGTILDRATIASLGKARLEQVERGEEQAQRAGNMLERGNLLTEGLGISEDVGNIKTGIGKWVDDFFSRGRDQRLDNTIRERELRKSKENSERHRQINSNEEVQSTYGY